jgi:hypothetical protein
MSLPFIGYTYKRFDAFRAGWGILENKWDFIIMRIHNWISIAGVIVYHDTFPYTSLDRMTFHTAVWSYSIMDSW